MNKKTYPRGYFRAAVLSGYVAVLVWLSLAPALPKIPLGALSWDKMQHFLAYFVLTLLAGWCFSPLFRSERLIWWGAFFFALALGAIMELAQGLFSTVRSADLIDLIADGLGALAASLAALTLLPAKWGNSPRRPNPSGQP
ncbi:MAG: VanZ family protein [Deltaproteobacteria bacterium]|nr:VanZ family protein [Deltaproteobacteria bacterium]